MTADSSTKSRQYLTPAFGLCFACAVACAPNPAQAAEPSNHEFGGALGLSWAQAREDLIVPVRFMGSGLDLRLRYRYETSGWELEADLHGGLLVLSDRYGTINAAVNPGIHGAWRLQLTPPAWLNKLSVGPSLGVGEMLGYLASWDDSHLYWIGMTSLGVSAQADRPLAGRTLRVTAQLPVIALVSRPPRYRLRKIDNVTSIGYWLGRLADRPTLTSWNQLQALQVKAQWRSDAVGWAWDPYVAIEFLSYASPKRATYLIYWLGLEIRR